MKFFCTALMIFLFLVPALFSQNEADSLRQAGDLEGAVAAYKDLLAEDPDNFAYNYDLACAYALNWYRDSAFHYLSIALEQDTTIRALIDPDLLGLTEDERWQAVEEEQISKVESWNGPYAKLDLARELWRMRMQDQAYYYHLEVAEQQNGQRSPIVRAIWDLKLRLNEENLTRLEEIIQTHGWPKESEVGSAAGGAAFLVIQHAELETQKQYIDNFRAACEAGEAPWSGYALMYDRIEMREGRPQLYGSQVIRDPETGELKPHEIKDPEGINARRAEMGLGPIEKYLARWGIGWAVEQKE